MSAANVSDILEQWEVESRERTARFRQMLLDMGRPDVLKDYDAAMWRVNSGVDRARNVWHSISSAQRRVLQVTGEGMLLRRVDVPSKFDAPHHPKIAGIKTLRNLKRRDLIVWMGELHDPESRAVLTGHAHFVLKHGPVAAQANVST